MTQSNPNLETLIQAVGEDAAVRSLVAMASNEYLKGLASPFPAKDIEWRVGRDGKTQAGKVWCKVLAYIDARAVMERLDDIVGPGNWKDRYWKEAGGTMCGLSIRVNGEWVEKVDGSDDTDIEAFKGGISKALVRSAVKWGLGRYLYNLTEGFAQVVERGAPDARYQRSKEVGEYYWLPPALPAWALPAAPGAKPAGKPEGSGADASAVANRTSATTEQLKGRLGGEQKGFPGPGAKGPAQGGARVPEPHSQEAADAFFEAAGERPGDRDQQRGGGTVPQGRDAGKDERAASKADTGHVQENAARVPGVRPSSDGNKVRESEVRPAAATGATQGGPGGNPVHHGGNGAGAGQGPSGGRPGQGGVVQGANATGPTPKPGEGRQVPNAGTAAKQSSPAGPAGQAPLGRADGDAQKPTGPRVGEAGPNLGAGEKLRQGEPGRIPEGAGAPGAIKDAGKGASVLNQEEKFELFTVLGGTLSTCKTLAELRKEWLAAQKSLYKLTEDQRTALEMLKDQQKGKLEKK